MRAEAAVRIDNDLAPGEAGVALRSANDEASRWLQKDRTNDINIHSLKTQVNNDLLRVRRNVY